MHIPIDPSATEPIYEQIRRGIADAIHRGDTAPGEALPSIRALARDLRVSVITTTRAYNELVADGLVDSIQGKGAFVRAQDPEVLREKSEQRIAAAFDEAVRAAGIAGIDVEDLHDHLDRAVHRSRPREEA